MHLAEVSLTWVKTGQLICTCLSLLNWPLNIYIGSFKLKAPIGAWSDINHTRVPPGLWLRATILNQTLAKAAVQQEYVVQLEKPLVDFLFTEFWCDCIDSGTDADSVISSCWLQLVQMAVLRVLAFYS